MGGRSGSSGMRGKSGGKNSPQEKARLSILSGGKSVKAKNEAAAVSALNKELKTSGDGHFWTVVKDKHGYNGKYTLAQSFRLTGSNGKTITRRTGKEAGGFNLVKTGDGTYTVKKGEYGYRRALYD